MAKHNKVEMKATLIELISAFKYKKSFHRNAKLLKLILIARAFLAVHSMSGLYGGIARSMSEKEIFKTMTNGTTKNNNSHTYGSATTRPRPVIPNRRKDWARFIGSAGHDHWTGRVPRQIHLLIPGDGFRMARRVRLRHPDHLAGGQLHQ